MSRIRLASLLAFAVAVPVAATFFTSHASPKQPCFVSGQGAYRMSGSAPANITVRIDNAAASPNVRLQVVDDAAAADFVLVDDSDAADSCKDANDIRSVRLDPAAAAPDLTVALSRAPAEHKIYVKSARFTEQDAAALFAAIWSHARKADLQGRAFAARP